MSTSRLEVLILQRCVRRTCLKGKSELGRVLLDCHPISAACDGNVTGLMVVCIRLPGVVRAHFLVQFLYSLMSLVSQDLEGGGIYNFVAMFFYC